MVYIFISKFNRTTNCRWRIISSYDGRNILFNAAYVFVVGISSFTRMAIDYQLRMGRLDLVADGPDKINCTLQILGNVFIILIGLGVTGFIGRILFLFTPLVTGTFYFYYVYN